MLPSRGPDLWPKKIDHEYRAVGVGKNGDRNHIRSVVQCDAFAFRLL